MKRVLRVEPSVYQHLLFDSFYCQCIFKLRDCLLKNALTCDLLPALLMTNMSLVSDEMKLFTN